MSNRLHADTETSLSTEWVTFCDEFHDFHNHCAFLLDAVCSMLLSKRELDSATLKGIDAYSYQMKQRAGYLKDQLEHIHNRSQSLFREGEPPEKGS